MGVSNLMGIGLSSLMANQAGMQVTGHNIANAHVEGFNRQRVEFSTARAPNLAALSVGRGVEATTISRAYDQFLSVEAGRAQGAAAFESTRETWLGRMEAAFPLGERGMAHAVNQFQGAWSDLANRPDDRALRQVVMLRGAAMADRFTAAAGQLSDLARGVRSELQQISSEVNRLARQIAQANEDISRASTLSQPANDLLDARDRLVDELRSLAGVTTLEGPSGALSVWLPSGHALVQDRLVQEMRVQDGATPDAPVTLQVNQGGQWTTVDSAALGAGTLGGLLGFQDGDLASTRSALADLSLDLVSSFNTVHQSGYVSLGPPAEPGGELLAYDAAFRTMSLATGLTADKLAAAGSLNVGEAATLKGNALRLAGLGDSPAAPGFTDDHGQLLSSVGTRVQQTRAASDLATALAEETRRARDGASGVNLDEEAARLMQYQQAYQAAAKMLQAAQTVVDSLLQVAR